MSVLHEERMIVLNGALPTLRQLVSMASMLHGSYNKMFLQVSSAITELCKRTPADHVTASQHACIRSERQLTCSIRFFLMFAADDGMLNSCSTSGLPGSSALAASMCLSSHRLLNLSARQVSAYRGYFQQCACPATACSKCTLVTQIKHITLDQQRQAACD
jgi:hypothetical protein